MLKQDGILYIYCCPDNITGHFKRQAKPKKSSMNKCKRINKKEDSETSEQEEEFEEIFMNQKMFKVKMPCWLLMK